MFTKNYDSIIKTFTKTVEQLTARRDELTNRIYQRKEHMNILMSENEVDTDEAAKCHNVADKIKELIKS